MHIIVLLFSYGILFKQSLETVVIAFGILQMDTSLINAGICHRQVGIRG